LAAILRRFLQSDEPYSYLSEHLDGTCSLVLDGRITVSTTEANALARTSEASGGDQ
jgi:hypothetical protein